MVAIYTAAASKTAPSAELGLSYVVDKDGLKVKGIKEGSPLALTALKEGHEIIAILLREYVETILSS